MAGPDYTDAFARLQSPNLLQQAGQALQMQQQMLAVQAQRKEMEAREALGPILQGAVDPKTGEFDFHKYFVGAAANPATAWKAQEILEKGIALKQTTTETALRELQKNREQAAAIYDAFGGLLPMREGITRADAANALKSAYDNGQIDKEHLLGATEQLHRLPESGPALYNYAKQVALRAQGASKALETTHKEITSRDVGGAEVFVQPRPLEGEVAKVGVLPKTLTPEKKGELVEGIDVDGSLTGERGASYKLPYEQVFPSGQVSAPGGQQGAGASQPQGAPPQRLLISGRPPQEAEALRKMGDQYDKVVELHNANRIFGSALDEAEKLMKNYTPQAGADVREKVARGLSAIGVSNEKVDAIANGSLSAGQAFRSVMLDLAAARMKKALEGGGRFTNLEWSGYTETKPNPEMDVRAVKDLIQYYRKTIKVEDAYVKGYLAHIDPRGGKNPLDFQKWWTGVVDKLRESEKKEREK